MTDEELIEQLRGEPTWGGLVALTKQAADRIEALLNLNEALVELMDDRDAKLAKAEAEAEKYKHAFSAQSRKLQAVLHIEGVKATLAEIKGESHE